MIPYKADVMMQRIPWANWAIIALTALVAVVDFSDDYNNPPPGLVLYSLNKDEQIDKVTVELEEYFGKALAKEFADELRKELADYGFKAHQLVTHTFLHAGVWHLFGNMVFLFVFGNAINAKIGHVPYLMLYLVLAVVSGIAWVLFPGTGIRMLGASGAVMGVAGMFLVLYPLNDVSMVMFFLWRPIFFSLSAVWVLSGYFVLDMLGFLNGGSDVAHVSHLAGMGAGAAGVTIMILTGLVRPGRGERTLPEVFRIKVKREDTPRTRSTIRTTPYTVKPPSVGTPGLKVVRRAQTAQTEELPAIELEGPVVGNRGELPPIEFGEWESTAEEEKKERGPIDLSSFEDEDGKA